MNDLISETGRRPKRRDTTDEPTAAIDVRNVMKVAWWHRFLWCTWSMWAAVFSATSGGLVAAFAGHSAGPWWQQRECLVCGKAQRRRVELKADRG